jgi:Fur family ferric uptake transcriptional regulator
MTSNELLRHHGPRVTARRLDLLSLLSSSDGALTHLELEGRLTASVDRVSIFRSLNAFEEAGLVHRVLDARGTSGFAPCADECGHGHHNDAHGHFRCTDRSHVFCLDAVDLPIVKLPDGFALTQGHLNLEGTCKRCT